MTRRGATPDGVFAATKRIAGKIRRTPLFPLIGSGNTIWIKAECLQEGGSFKIRGATNRLTMLNEAERKRGVVAFSSGNHAQGVALAAQRMDIPATIVMPSDAPAVKRDGTLAAGARIVEYDRKRESREEIAARLAWETGATLVPSFDDVDIIHGQGSVGVELGEQIREQGLDPRCRIFVPCGGGGLSAGIALAMPEAEIVPVEPQGWDDMTRSLGRGERVAVDDDAPPTLCDALLTRIVSPLTFDVLRERGARGRVVSESEVKRAMFMAAVHLRLVVEPGGAAGLAAALVEPPDERLGATIAIVSGGNVDPLVYADILASQAADTMRNP